MKSDMFNYRAISMCIVVLLASILAYIGIVCVINSCYHPDIEALKELGKSFTFDYLNPEPVESLLFQVGVLSIPLLMLGFFFLATRTKLKNVNAEGYFNQLSIGLLLLICAILYFGYAAPNPPYDNSGLDTNFQFYFSHSVLYNQLPVLFLVAAVAFGLMLVMKQFEKQLVESKTAKITGIVLISIYACVCFTAIWKMYPFDFPHSLVIQWNLAPVYYPVTQAYAGTPNLIDGLSSNYGSFAWFLNPIFQIFGLSVRNFTTVMTVLVILTFSLILVAMFNTVKSKVLVLISWASILYLCRLSWFLGSDEIDPVFAMFPIRQIIPAVAICLASFYVYNKSKLLYFVTHIVLAFSIIWNPEFGIVCFVAWIAVLCYLEFDKTDWKKIATACAKHIVLAIAALALALAIFFLSVYAKTGQFPDILLQFYSMMFFGKFGYLALPMTLIHPWNFVLLIYAIGLVYALYALFDRKYLTPKSAFILLLSVIGVGTFSYFQGRSIGFSLALVEAPALFLLAIFADTMWDKGKIKQMPVPFILATAGIVIMLSSSCIDLYKNRDHWEKLANPVLTELEILEKKLLETEILFLQEKLPHTTPKVFLNTLAKFQPLYFGAIAKRSAFNPSLVDMFMIEQRNRFAHTILVDTFDVFLEPQGFHSPVYLEVNAATAATYTLNATNGIMAYMKKRKYATLPTPFLHDKDAKNTLLYEKFADDIVSLKQRINLAVTGVEPVDWGTTLSAEVVFFNDAQIYPFATLFNNSNDTAGIDCFKISTSPFEWRVNCGAYGTTFMVEPNAWHYLAIEIHDNMLEIYLNGSFVQRAIFPEPIRSSDERLTVCNRMDANQHFVGAVSEILLSKTNLTAAEIRERWRTMNNEQ
ncbi:hypothetical protein AGMMS49525_05250 [Bacteroidia bacterium]|nr:hypothetical protein AGMMS49525_05250 [Bacteroidia bacterium]